MAPPPPPPPPPRRPPALMDELVEEVLLRFPPDDPASLVRAALVSKLWCRLISGHGFRRRFREIHRTPPVLGFICNVDAEDRLCICSARFVPTSSCLPHADHLDRLVLDSRHGRVLLYTPLSLNFWGGDFAGTFAVWDPPHRPFNATVLCDDDDDACRHHGRFLVVFVGICNDAMSFYVYSSATGAWGEPTIAQHPRDLVDRVPPAVLGNAVYFLFVSNTRMVKYDLGTRHVSLIDLTPSSSYGRNMLMTTDQGRLGFARTEDFRLYLWSMEIHPQDGGVLWAQDRVIQLRNLLPAGDALLSSPGIAGCVNGRIVVLVGTEDGYFTIDTMSDMARKVGEGVVCKKEYDGDGFYGHDYYIHLEQSQQERNQVQAHQVHDGLTALKLCVREWQQV
ncbi:hypothetical protein U9M48_011483 [Paspalum notatum var. saurae]|uniref:F-box domain-containing protein n=1 Tax=Paspalum notatum var. saurae TaxID=547442 RepID=A0AAQ3SWD2_PASNO